jgi:hypothetical protein
MVSHRWQGPRMMAAKISSSMKPNRSPHLGKTTVARAVADYLQTLEPRLVDTQVPAGDLKGFYPKAEVLDLTAPLGRCRSSTGPYRSR